MPFTIELSYFSLGILSLAARDVLYVDGSDFLMACTQYGGLTADTAAVVVVTDMGVITAELTAGVPPVAHGFK